MSQAKPSHSLHSLDLSWIYWIDIAGEFLSANINGSLLIKPTTRSHQLCTDMLSKIFILNYPESHAHTMAIIDKNKCNDNRRDTANVCSGKWIGSVRRLLIAFIVRILIKLRSSICNICIQIQSILHEWMLVLLMMFAFGSVLFISKRQAWDVEKEKKETHILWNWVNDNTQNAGGRLLLDKHSMMRCGFSIGL